MLITLIVLASITIFLLIVVLYLFYRLFVESEIGQECTFARHVVTNIRLKKIMKKFNINDEE